ncbi:protein SON isoform X2 [Cephus cinctus]|uniref:Protein SON isoform X2 n=1 Tax=Cephus cinctus TaxID=211228 RepID=A0AAJ7FMV9_CEPCN|nr:protein SON isoform X2 [Cephus cinctus]
MADLFDIANLITTVGVDAVKIKPEPGLPQKSSNEILTELFSTFDADEGIVSPEHSDTQIPDKEIKVEKQDKSKKKKSKKKHKHKDKKHKKKSKKNSSDSNSDAENGSTKKKKKHKKKSKRRHDSVSSKSSDSEEPKAKMKKVEDIPDSKNNAEQKTGELNNIENILVQDTKLQDHSIVKKEPQDNESLMKTSSPQLPPISKKTDDESDETIISKILEKPKQGTQGKILIKDLKNSIVYNETVKEVENKERAKAARMEDGELSDSSEDNGTPTLSPTPPRNDSPRTGLISPILNKSNKTSLSPIAVHDLRLVLKEKEKKRLKDVNGSRLQSNRKENKSYKESKDKDSRHSRSSRSRERKRSESETHSNSRHSRSRTSVEKRTGRSKERRNRDKSIDRCDHERNKDKRKYARDEKERHRSRSEDKNRNKSLRGRSRSRERKERIEIDKKKLLEIARRNAINMIKQGTLPLAQQDKAIAAIQDGGKSVDELTDFCKSLSKSEALGELSSISSDDDGSSSEKGFHHPFLVKDRPSSIIMNIKDAKQLPTKTFQEKTAESSNQLRLQFPVSSGQHHRKTESEWVPVIPKKPEPKKAFLPASAPLISVPPAPLPILPPPVPAPVIQPAVFPQTPPIENVDIGSIVSQRLAAMRKLRENPNDVQALGEMYRAQTEMKTWAESKQMPGQFTGSTGAKVLSAAELSAGYQAWARKARSYIREESASAAR